MARVVATEAALGDEAAILADLGAKGGYRVAEKYKALLDRFYGLLADHPAIGPRLPRVDESRAVAIDELPASIVTVLRNSANPSPRTFCHSPI